MPLLALLHEGYQNQKPAGWHRRQERSARGLATTTMQQQQLEPWEMELLLVEILVLTGHDPSGFVHLAHAWGQPTGFHLHLGRSILMGSTTATTNTGMTVNEVSEEEESAETTTTNAAASLLLAQQQQPQTAETRHRQEPVVKTAASQQKQQTHSPLDTLIALLSSPE